MTVTPISPIRSKVTPDDGKWLQMPNDENYYSEIICKTKMVSKITEVELEAYYE